MKRTFEIEYEEDKIKSYPGDALKAMFEYVEHQTRTEYESGNITVSVTIDEGTEKSRTQ
jgi:hypothetical protein